jgi:NAD(P)H-nitrite reductase large subunit
VKLAACGVPLTKPQLIATAREQGLKSVSSVFKALAGGVEDAASKPALASLLATIWNDAYEDERGESIPLWMEESFLPERRARGTISRRRTAPI